VTDCRVGGGIKTEHREHVLHRVCLNPFWSLDAIAFIMAASGFYQNEMKLLEGRPAAPTPPKSAPGPLGVTVRGGCRGWGVSRGGKGRRGVLAYPVLYSLLTGFNPLILITDRLDCAFWDAHNQIASASNTGSYPFCEASLRLEGEIRRLQVT
jgi:hypothetical protein